MIVPREQVAPDAAALILQAQRLAGDDLGHYGRLFSSDAALATVVGMPAAVMLSVM